MGLIRLDVGTFTSYVRRPEANVRFHKLAQTPTSFRGLRLPLRYLHSLLLTPNNVSYRYPTPGRDLPVSNHQDAPSVMSLTLG